MSSKICSKLFRIPAKELFSSFLSQNIESQLKYGTQPFQKSPTYKVVFVRHGESTWNAENRFCGWYDSPLSPTGSKQAVAAGKLLKNQGYCFNYAFTSVLSRAQETLALILSTMDLKICIRNDWRLNERHYGALTGLNKSETAQKYGDEQVAIWRRSFNTPPPKMDDTHEFYKTIRSGPMYADGPEEHDFPNYESLKMTMTRTLPLWKDIIIPKIRSGKKIIISAHGNSLRAIIKHIDAISDDQILKINVPNGLPFTYEFDRNMKPIKGKSLQYLGDVQNVEDAIHAVDMQGKS